MMYKTLKWEILNEVRSSIAELDKIYNEVWMTADQLCERYPCFTKSWIKSYGEILPRERVIVWNEETGAKHKTSFAYPLSSIERFIEDRNFLKL